MWFSSGQKLKTHATKETPACQGKVKHRCVWRGKFPSWPRHRKCRCVRLAQKPHACGGNRWCLADSNIRVLSDESDTKQVTRRWATRKRGWGSAMLSLSFSYSCYGTGLPHIGCHVAILVFSASLPRRVITGQSTDRGRSAVRTSNKKGNMPKRTLCRASTNARNTDVRWYERSGAATETGWLVKHLLYTRYGTHAYKAWATRPTIGAALPSPRTRQRSKDGRFYE